MKQQQQHPFDETIEEYSFQQLASGLSSDTEAVLEAIDEISSALSREEGDFFHDRINYRRLIELDYSKYPNFGRFFLIKSRKDRRYVGFLLCFDDVAALKAGGTSLDVHNRPKSAFPLDHCGNFLTHDIRFLQDLYHLREFAYVYQVGVLPYYQYQRGGELLINAFENHYERLPAKKGKRQRPIVFAGALHEKQFHVFQLLRKRQKEDQRYMFLDHYFDTEEPDQHWFRMVKLLDSASFVRKLNSELLSKAYHTIIPMQLNQAVASVNRIIKEMDAKILWSSFFNANELLRERFNMREDNHSFFGALLETGERAVYDAAMERLRKITTYLSSRNNRSGRVPSLISLLERNNVEFYFFSEDAGEHQLNSFAKTCVLNVSDEERMTNDFFDHLRFFRSQDFKLLDQEQKSSWWQALHKVAKLTPHSLAATREKVQEDWREWKAILNITDEEEKVLLRGITLLKKGARQQLEEAEKQYIEDYRRKVRNINDERKIIAPERYQAWVRYLSLHPLLHKIDLSATKDKAAYWWCHAVIPINYSDGQNVSGIMFSFRCRKLSRDHPDYHWRMGQLAELIASALSKNMLNMLIKLQQKATKEAANRYATAGILSRNLAHNFGSHILTRLDKEDKLRELGEITYPAIFYKKMAQFLGYLRVRTNLLADMSTSEPVSTTGMWLRQELVKNMNEQSILKQYISNSKLKAIEIVYRYKGEREGKDVKVQIPNGDLGASALFMILENVIRNSAKHENITNRSVLTVSLDVYEENRRGYHIAIYDDIARGKGLEELVGKINDQYIKKRVIDKQSRIRGKAWGIMEMRAAASYLRKKVPGIALGEERRRYIPLLRADKQRLPEQSEKDKPAYTMAYHIYLKKPRTLLLVDLSHSISGDIAQLAHARSEVRLHRPYEEQTGSKTVYSHKFAVHFQEEDRRQMERQKRFPLRWILMEDTAQWEGLSEMLQSEPDEDSLLRWLWQHWLEHYCKNKGLPCWFLKLTVTALHEEPPPIEDIQKAPEQLLLFDSHGEWAKKHPEFELGRLGFYTSHRSNCSFGTYLHNVSSLSMPHHTERLRYELIEAAVTEIIIVDERIQEYAAGDRRSRGSDLFQTLRHMNVYLPDPGLEEPDLQQIRDEAALEQWLVGVLREHTIDFVVLHLGLIESIVGSDMPAVQAWLQACIRKVDERPEIVLASGRGKPHDLPKDMCYQPYGTLARHLIQGLPSKYHLVQSLFSSRTRMGL